MKLSVVLPCYNEEENVKRIPSELVPVLDSLGCDYEMIAVDDGCKDNTVSALEALHLPKLVIVRHDVNKGLAAALRTGLAAATGDQLIFLDTDFTFHPSLIPHLLKAKAEKHVDFVIGSPFLGGYDKDIPAWRIVISKFSNWLYAFLLGREATSINQIFRLYNTADLKALTIEANGFEINAEILFKLVYAGKTFAEIPAELTQRTFGVSKLNYKKEIIRHLGLLVKIIGWKLARYTRVIPAWCDYLIVGVLAALFGFFRLGFQSIWNDEGISIELANRSVSWLTTEVVKFDLHPPTYYILLHYWQAVFGTTIEAYRSLSTGAYIATSVALYAIAKRLWAHRGIAFLVALVFITNPFAVYHAQETRSYMLLILATTLNYFFFNELCTRPRGRAFLGYGLSALVLIYINILSPIILIAHALYVLGSKQWRLVKTLGILYAALVLLYVPFLAVLWKVASGNYSYVYKESLNIFLKLAAVLGGFAGGRVNIVNAEQHRYDLLILSAVVYMYVAYLAVAQWKKLHRPLLTIGALSFGIMFVVSAWKFPAIDPKYFFMVFPIFILLVGNTLLVTPPIRYAIALVLIFTLNGLFLYNYYFVKTYERENWKHVVAMVEDDYQKNLSSSAIVISPVSKPHSTWVFYSHRYMPEIGALAGGTSASDIAATLDAASVSSKSIVYDSRFLSSLYDPEDVVVQYLEAHGFKKTKDFHDTKVEFWRFDKITK